MWVLVVVWPGSLLPATALICRPHGPDPQAVAGPQTLKPSNPGCVCCPVQLRQATAAHAHHRWPAAAAPGGAADAAVDTGWPGVRAGVGVGVGVGGCHAAVEQPDMGLGQDGLLAAATVHAGT